MTQSVRLPNRSQRGYVGEQTVQQCGSPRIGQRYLVYVFLGTYADTCKSTSRYGYETISNYQKPVTSETKSCS